jgi:hypothetical protein
LGEIVIRYKDDASLYTTLVYRRLTAKLRVLPGVFSLGGTKCGSTSIAYLLRQHPAFVSPFKKELMYLQRLPNFESNYEYNQRIAFFWGRYNGGSAEYSALGYRKFFPLRSEIERKKRSYGTAFTADCDPFNFYCPVATQRIKNLVPDAKFIIVLRNPVDRAYSDYNMYRDRAGETRTFEQVVRDELSGTEKRFRRKFILQSMYATHLRRWFTEFPRDRFIVLRSEDLFLNERSVAAEIFSFLGLPVVQTVPVKMNGGSYACHLSPEQRAKVRELFKDEIGEISRILSRDMHW